MEDNLGLSSKTGVASLSGGWILKFFILHPRSPRHTRLMLAEHEGALMLSYHHLELLNAFQYLLESVVEGHI